MRLATSASSVSYSNPSSGGSKTSTEPAWAGLMGSSRYRNDASTAVNRSGTASSSQIRRTCPPPPPRSAPSTGTRQPRPARGPAPRRRGPVAADQGGELAQGGAGGAAGAQLGQRAALEEGGVERLPVLRDEHRVADPGEPFQRVPDTSLRVGTDRRGTHPGHHHGGRDGRHPGQDVQCADQPVQAHRVGGADDHDVVGGRQRGERGAVAPRGP